MKRRGNSGGNFTVVISAVACATVGALWSSPALVGQTAAQPPAQTTAPAEVTFTKDVAPILQRTCQNCHRPAGGLAPMALTTYEEVRPWARAIKERTAKR